jgi:L-ascorbate oxidase
MSGFHIFTRNISASLASAFAVGMALFSSATANAQNTGDVPDPPVLQPRGAPPVTAEAVTGVARGPSEQLLDLNIEYVKGTIPNPSTGRNDAVYLRSYTRAGEPKPTLFISPAIHTRPGDVLRINLNNLLPATPPPGDSGCASADQAAPDQPHCFNGTNLHTHGLWVNPAGNGDNVLLSINPGVSFQYEYAIPTEHPAGTFWYHTHRHGSTALQVSSGMAGALIIYGDRLPTPTKTGDLDTLLAGMKERTLVLQQIQYYCGEDSQGNMNYNCGAKDVGVIESYDAFGPGSWGASGRYTSINGLVLPGYQNIPPFRAVQGQVERWRIIHGGVRDTIGLQFVKATGTPKLTAGRKLAASRMAALVGQTCGGAVLPMHLAAADGLTMAAALPTDVATFQPGYRFDALVVFPEAGNYCVLDVDTGAAGSVGGVPSGTRLLGMVQVGRGQAVSGKVGDYLTQQLVAAAQQTMPDDVKATVVDDLQQGLKFSSFVPHPTVDDGELTGTQELTFRLDFPDPNGPPLFEVANQLKGSPQYDPQPYKPDRVDRKLTLGGVDEWTLQSQFVSHPFHIHVNPFQIVSITDPYGRDVSDPNVVDNYALGATPAGIIDPQYRGLKGVWKDTLWIKSLIGEVNQLPPVPGSNPPVASSGVYTIKIRTRYQRYVGEYVLHCHILDHEDQGMMQNVAVVLPGGTPASVNAPEGGHAH